MSKYAKPMYSTRVITKCCEPIYEEDTAILVTPEIIKANECLSLQLWDSDRFTPDDLLGKVEIDINDLIRASKKGLGMEKRTDNLVGFDKETTEPGQLIWSGMDILEIVDK
jgi:Ca2+-dependent lipid-binding protein